MPSTPFEEVPGSPAARSIAGPRVFPARMDAFPSVRSFVEEVCRAAAFGRDDCAKLVLLIEELFTNTVLHGHGGDSDASVHLALEVAAGQVSLTYEDAARPHNPFASWKPPDAASSVEDRRVGGLGVVLVASMAQRVRYAYTAGRNRICLVMVRSS